MKTPVLIVGGGPVGLTLSLVFAKFGVDCIVIERNTSTTKHPKMDITNSRSMEIFRFLGVDDRIHAAAVSNDICLDVSWVSKLTGYEIHRFTYPSPAQARENYRALNDGTLSTEADIRISQILVEPLLRDAALNSRHVTIRYGCELINLAQDDSGVTAILKENGSGKHKTIRSQYLVGCDGGNSKVRNSLKIGVSGDAKIRSRYSIHFRSKDKYIFEPWGPAWHYQSPVHGTLVSQDGVERYTLHSYLSDAETAETVDPYTKVRNFVGRDFHFDLLKAIHWDNNLLVADRYRDGRVILAGDATHQYIPTGGYGMNTGVGDALDVGWKLSAVVQDWGGDTLLNSVEEERRPVALRNREGSKRHAEVRIAIGSIWQENIDDPSEKGDTLRESLGEKIADIGNAENESRGIEIGYNYSGSPIVCNQVGDETPSDSLHYIPTTTPGCRPPALYLSDGSSLFDLFGTGFALLNFEPDKLDAATFQEEAKKFGIPFSVVSIRDDHAKRLYQYSLVLIRPDQHVAWRGMTIPEDVVVVLKTVTGHFTGNRREKTT